MEEDPGHTNLQPGWYPDAQMVGTVRYWDGQRWTENTAPAPVPGPAPTPTPTPTPLETKERKWTTGKLIGLAFVAFWLLGGLGWAASHLSGGAANSDLADYSCDDLAQEAVQVSQDQGGLVQLLKVRGVVERQDNRSTYTLPSGTGEALVLSCEGTGVWSDLSSTPVVLRLTVDSDGQSFVEYRQSG